MIDKRQRDISAIMGESERVLWNFYNLYNPRVVRSAAADYPYAMMFFGEATKEESGYDVTFLARSRDLSRWEVFDKAGGWDDTMTPALWQPVVTRGEKPFDNIHAGDPSVIRRGGLYSLAYSAVGFDRRVVNEKEDIFIINCVMGAQSTDLIHWTKSEKPLLIWEGEYDHGWEIHQPKPHNHAGYHRPSLLFDEGRYKLWFDYYLDGTFLSMGYAENASGAYLDANAWTILRKDGEPCLRDWPNPSIVKLGPDYFSFSDPPSYDTPSPTHRRTCIAHSKDGLNWQVLGHLMPSADFGAHVAEPFLDEDGRLYLFYSLLPDYDMPRYKEIVRVRLDIDKLYAYID